MRVAVLLFGERVSPRFDCATEFLVVDVLDGKVAEKEVASLARELPLERIARLLELGVSVVICGGIEGATARILNARGIQLYSWVNGTVDDVLGALLRGDLESGMTMGTGGRCRVRRRFRGPETSPSCNDERGKPMPNRDGDGPRGQGRGSGRGRGRCGGAGRLQSAGNGVGRRQRCRKGEGKQPTASESGDRQGSGSK